MTKKRIVFFVVTIALLTGLATQVHGQATMRRNIFRVGGSLGYCYALFHLDRTTPDIFPEVQRLQDNAERWLRAIIREYTPPFSSDGLQNILSRLERFDPQTSRTHVNNRQRANFYRNIRDGVKESLALTYGHETREHFKKEPTCESVLLYIGYHFGEWLVYTREGQENLRRRSLGNLTRMINQGKQVVAALKCALMDLSVFDRIDFAGARSNDIQRINDELERAINSLAAGDPNRTSPSQRSMRRTDMDRLAGTYIVSARGYTQKEFWAKLKFESTGSFSGWHYMDQQYRKENEFVEGVWSFNSSTQTMTVIWKKADVYSKAGNLIGSWGNDKSFKFSGNIKGNANQFTLHGIYPSGASATMYFKRQ